VASQNQQIATSGFPATRALCGSDGFGPGRPVDRCWT